MQDELTPVSRPDAADLDDEETPAAVDGRQARRARE
jgi:hypothetical protein